MDAGGRGIGEVEGRGEIFLFVIEFGFSCRPVIEMGSSCHYRRIVK